MATRYRPWVRSLQNKLEADVQKAWGRSARRAEKKEAEDELAGTFGWPVDPERSETTAFETKKNPGHGQKQRSDHDA